METLTAVCLYIVDMAIFRTYVVVKCNYISVHVSHPAHLPDFMLLYIINQYSIYVVQLRSKYVYML